MKTDSQIQKDVSQALAWDPSITHELIGVAVSEGILTLTGSVPSYFEKSEAETVAQRVGGVKAVVEKIEVRLNNAHLRDDQDIAKAILSQFKWSFSVPDSVKVSVEKGWVEISGEVDWEFQRSAAKNCIKDLLGVKGVLNNITIKAKNVQPETIKQRIEDALNSEAKREAGKIQVGVNGGIVTLTGEVHSLAEKNNAKWAAWGAAGVTTVENNLRVSSH